MRLTELELSSERLDQPRQVGLPRRKILILSPPRSGSTLLCRLMLQADLGIAHEYFNPNHIFICGRRFGIAELASPFAMKDNPSLALRYIDDLYAVRTRDGLFAAKIQYAQYQAFLRGPPTRSLFDGAALVYLTRRDVVAQAVSLHVAQVTGRWGFEGARLTRSPNQGERGDFAAITAALTGLRAEERCWERLFQELGRSPLRLTYEELCADAPAMVAAIAAHAGAALPADVVVGEAEGRYPEDEGHELKALLVARYRQFLAFEAARVP